MPPLGGESMNRTTWLQDRRMDKFCDVLSRWKARELSAQEAGEILGCSERQFRRYRRRYEEEGLEYNSCRNRHCPKCQAAAAKEWLAAREAELLPVPYFHAVFSLPAQIADIAYHNKAV